ncbi:hypothetical protein HKI87_02g11790 [Chloropicon roscoffensis]|uniref:Uncharacterized protein n=1 Tax=Chloropicon roscoffensis TaxID=1461544 RepID=A0AAX4P156_9CHLO
MAHFGQARAVTRAAFAAVLCLALLAGRCCRGAVPQESNSRRRILQSGFSREAQLEWFRSADADVQGWTEMFSVDQQTKKEIIIGAAAENPWGTLCNSIAECS